jgi:hypothetical protein
MDARTLSSVVNTILPFKSLQLLAPQPIMRARNRFAVLVFLRASRYAQSTRSCVIHAVACLREADIYCVIMHLYYWMCSSTALQVASASIQIRSARPNDIPYMRKINIKTLPENYTPEWWDHHLASWPQMTLVAEHSEPDQQSVIVGYALGQIQVGLPMAQLLLQLSAIRLL